tara:strand:+ start:2952 stop:3503 length:552 start_codon:yes stop_codon:yes gene_type:complete
MNTSKVFEQNFSATKFWFESGKMTSGSRANLDLSLSGINGINGGVSLFGICPGEIDKSGESEEPLKLINIIYQGITYEQNPIVYPNPNIENPNGTARLQIGGISSDGHKITDIVGMKNSDEVGPLQGKIIVFNRVNECTYTMDVFDYDNNIENFETQSMVVSCSATTTGKPRKNGRKFGVLEV